jgi:hypothetical protein
MIEPTRKDVLRILEELSEACPEYRFGQMIANLAMLARGDAEGAVWDMEDDELLAAARKHLEDWRRRQDPGELAEEDEFDRAILASAHKLSRLATEALAEDRAGLTEELDPDTL